MLTYIAIHLVFESKRMSSQTTIILINIQTLVSGSKTTPNASHMMYFDDNQYFSSFCICSTSLSSSALFQKVNKMCKIPSNSAKFFGKSETHGILSSSLEGGNSESNLHMQKKFLYVESTVGHTNITCIK